MAKSRLTIRQVRKPDAGIVRNSPFELVDPRALMDGNNTRVRPGRIEKVKGWTQFSATALPGTIMLLDVATFFSGTVVLLVADTKRVYSYNTSTAVLDDVTGSDLTTSASVLHSSGMWKDHWIYTNALSVVKKWTGSGNIATLGGLTDCEPGGVVVSAAKVLCPAGPFMFLANTTEDGSPYPFRVRWPKYDTLETWKNDVSGNGQAGYMDVAEEPTPIKNIVPLGNYYAVYKERSVQLLTYVGLPVIWSRRQVAVGRGLLAPKAVVSLGDFHIAAFTDNFYIFNGASLQAIGNPIRDDFFAALNPNKKDLMFAFHLEDKAEVVFAYPGLTSDTPDKAVVYNYLLNAWSFRDFPFTGGVAYLSQSTTAWQNGVGTWGTQTNNWDYRNFLTNSPIPIVGDATNKKIFQYDTTDGKNGSDLAGFATSTLTDLGRPDNVKRVIRLSPICEKLDVDMSIYIITADQPRGDNVENGPYTFNPSTDTKIDIDLVSSFFAVKFSTSLINEPFTVSGWVWEYHMEEDR